MTKLRGIAARLVTLLALLSAVLVSPGTAVADVYPSCTISGCEDAETAIDGWGELNWPTNRGWHAWPYGEDNFSGGEYHNYEGELPEGHTYQEYDVYPRPEGDSRDAHRIVRDVDTGDVWYTPDHYNDFYVVA